MRHNDHDLDSQTGESIPLLAPEEESSDMAAENDHDEVKHQPTVEDEHTDGDSRVAPSEPNNQVEIEGVSKDAESSQAESSSQPPVADEERRGSEEEPVYKVYKIRWFGLTQLVLLNIIVSWDVCRTLIYSSSQRDWLMDNHSGYPSPQ